MTGKDLRQLEKDLTGDLVYSDRAVLERVRKLVREFLMHEAGLLTDRHIKDEEQIIDLIQLHSRVNLLRALVENPKGFTLKDQRELFRSVGDTRGGDNLQKNVNPLAMIEGLDISDKQKAQLVQATMDTMRDRLRGALTEGKKP